MTLPLIMYCKCPCACVQKLLTVQSLERKKCSGCFVGNCTGRSLLKIYHGGRFETSPSKKGHFTDSIFLLKIYHGGRFETSPSKKGLFTDSIFKAYDLKAVYADTGSLKEWNFDEDVTLDKNTSGSYEVNTNEEKENDSS